MSSSAKYKKKWLQRGGSAKSFEKVLGKILALTRDERVDYRQAAAAGLLVMAEKKQDAHTNKVCQEQEQRIKYFNCLDVTRPNIQQANPILRRLPFVCKVLLMFSGPACSVRNGIF